MSEISLNLLDPIDAIEQKTSSEILAEINEENATAANPEGRIYRGWALREQFRRKQEDSNVKGLLLAFATGDTLDFIGETYYRNSDGTQITRKTGESDDDYRIALQESPEGLTSAGTLASYDFHASRAHDLIDRYKVKSYSPEPMEMITYFISDDENETEIKTAIESYLKTFVPGGDLYSAVRATEKSRSINGVVRCSDGVGLELVESQGLAALTTYISDSKRINGIISNSGIKDALTVEGVKQILLTDWIDIECTESEYPAISKIDEELDIKLTYEVI